MTVLMVNKVAILFQLHNDNGLSTMVGVGQLFANDTLMVISQLHRKWFANMGIAVGGLPITVSMVCL